MGARTCRVPQSPRQWVSYGGEWPGPLPRQVFGGERVAVDVLRKALTDAQAPTSSNRLDPVQILQMQFHLAWWTGNAGDATEARQLTQELAADSARILGPEHHLTIFSRRNVARWIGKS
jgi:hypothetical protein